MRKAQQILQLKKKKEQQAPTEPPADTTNDQGDDVEQVVQKKKNMFAAFSDDSQQQTKQQIEDDTQSNKEKVEEPLSQPSKKKKNKNKNKKKPKELNEQEQMDKLFEHAGLNNLNAQESNKQQQPSKIFLINQNKFNYQNQLKKYFKSAEDDQPVPENKQGMNKRQKKYQKMMQNIKMKKSVLIPGNMNYFPIGERFEFVEKEGMLWIEASEKYQVLQEEYEAIKNSNDIQEMFNFMQKNPYHTDSLYNIGEYFRLKGNYKEADELIQRIIYIYEYSSQYNIGQFVKENHPHKQIAYGRYSISLFMALFKFIDILGKKGCYRAGLEYCKLLLKLNLEDPSACLLTLDYNALSAKQYQYLIDFTHYFPRSKGKQFENKLLYWLPNFTYSFALAKFLIQTDVVSKSIIEESDIQSHLVFSDSDVEAALDISRIHNYYQESTQVLILRAILLYPHIFLQLADKNQYSKQFLSHSSFKEYQKGNYKAIKEHKFFEQAPESYFYTFLNIESEASSKGLGRVIECFVTRSHIVWKNNKVMLWVKAAAGFLLNYIDSHQKFNYSEFQESLSIKSKLNENIPSICIQLSKYQNVSKGNFMNNVERIDLNNIQDNQGFQVPQQPQNYNPVNVQDNPFRLFLNTLLPWVHLPQQGQNGQNAEQDPDMPIIEEERPN